MTNADKLMAVINERLKDLGFVANGIQYPVDGNDGEITVHISKQIRKGDDSIRIKIPEQLETINLRELF